MNEYKINKKTLAIMPINDEKSKIYETDNIVIVQKSVQKIIEENCEYYGSSYSGRKKGTVEMIGVTHKSPIVIEDSCNIIFFPTCSPRLHKCSWISLNNIEDYKTYQNNSVIKFQNDFTLQVHVSVKIINNQILRATRLESVLHRRKANLIEKN